LLLSFWISPSMPSKRCGEFPSNVLFRLMLLVSPVAST